MKRGSLLLALWTLGPALALAQPSQRVVLSPLHLSDSARYFGAKALNFKRSTSAPAGVPAEWQEIATAALVENPALETLTVIRYRDASGALGYAIPEGGKALDPSCVLRFRQVGERSVADRTLTFMWQGKRDAKPVVAACQVVIAKDRVTARLAECREGTIKIGKDSYAVRLYAPSVNNPSYVLSQDAVCLIDFNRDGDFTPAWHLSDSSGEVVAAERIALLAPFVAGGKRLIAVGIDSAGTHLDLKDFPGEIYATTGFKAPDLTFLDMSGTTRSLGALRGKVVLLTFWATTCGYCERIRPALNTLVKSCPPAKFQAIAAASQTDMQELFAYLRGTPYEGLIVPYDAKLWQTYNRRMTTPVFFLIDPQGTIRVSGSGASLFAVVDRYARNLLEMP